MPTDTVEALRRACWARGLTATGAQLIHHSSNAVYVLPAEAAVARVNTSDPDGARATRIHALTRWLVEQHRFPATEPMPGVDPVLVDQNVSVGFWRWYRQPAGAPPNSRDLGRLLRQLHALPPPAHIELPAWTPLESLEAALLEDQCCAALADADRSWLLARVAELRAKLAGLDWALPLGLIHGDAWAGNLLRDSHTHTSLAILCDWDWVSIGPCEVDLIPTWHAAIRYGRDQPWVQQFIESYGYDLSTWAGYSTLLHMRDLVQITDPLRRATTSRDIAARLRQHVTDIRDGDRTASWASY